LIFTLTEAPGAESCNNLLSFLPIFFSLYVAHCKAASEAKTAAAMGKEIIRLNPVRGSSFYKALEFKTLQKEEPLTGLEGPNCSTHSCGCLRFARCLAMGYKGREK